MASQNGRRPGYLRSANQNHQNFPEDDDENEIDSLLPKNELTHEVLYVVLESLIALKVTSGPDL